MKDESVNEQEKDFPVREGGEESSILHDKKPLDDIAYPQPALKDKQVKNQPEYTEEQPNRESPSSPAPNNNKI